MSVLSIVLSQQDRYLCRLDLDEKNDMNGVFSQIHQSAWVVSAFTLPSRVDSGDRDARATILFDSSGWLAMDSVLIRRRGPDQAG